jgi:HPt (histidine-containing phosphotransfer) domain-containing protein
MQDKETGTQEFRRSAELQQEMEKIGGRFLERVLADFDAIEKALQELRSGNAAAAGTLEMSAHRIHGSSAIFGFAALSEVAGALEALLMAVRSQGDPVAAAPDIAVHIDAMRTAAQAARAVRAAN